MLFKDSIKLQINKISPQNNLVIILCGLSLMISYVINAIAYLLTYNATAYLWNSNVG